MHFLPCLPRLWPLLGAEHLPSPLNTRTHARTHTRARIYPCGIDVDWFAFSEPELCNFLRMLDAEELLHRKQVEAVYKAKRARLQQKLDDIRNPGARLRLRMRACVPGFALLSLSLDLSRPLSLSLSLALSLSLDLAVRASNLWLTLKRSALSSRVCKQLQNGRRTRAWVTMTTTLSCSKQQQPQPQPQSQPQPQPVLRCPTQQRQTNNPHSPNRRQVRVIRRRRG